MGCSILFVIPPGVKHAFGVLTLVLSGRARRIMCACTCLRLVSLLNGHCSSTSQRPLHPARGPGLLTTKDTPPQGMWMVGNLMLYRQDCLLEVFIEELEISKTVIVWAYFCSSLYPLHTMAKVNFIVMYRYNKVKS